MTSDEVAQLKHAIDTNDLVVALMTQNPALHGAPLGYRENGPLTWVAECRIPWEPPTRARLAMATWMLDHGSDVHQGGDGPLTWVAECRIPMVELLSPAEPTSTRPGTAGSPSSSRPASPLIPSPSSGSSTTAPTRTRQSRPRRPPPPPSTISLAPTLAPPACLFASTSCLPPAGSPATISRPFWTFSAGGSMLWPRTSPPTPTWSTVDFGGQIPIFHAVTQFEDRGLPVAHLLLDHGTDLTVHARIPGQYDQPAEIIDCTPLGYALQFPSGQTQRPTVALLQERGGL